MTRRRMPGGTDFLRNPTLPDPTCDSVKGTRRRAALQLTFLVMDTLSVELCRRITEDVPFKGLFSLVTVSRVFQAEAARILWRQVRLARRDAMTVISKCHQILDSPPL
jgi:hypothetical protein